MSCRAVLCRSRVLKIVLSILIAAHFVACAWHWVGSGPPQHMGLDAAGNEKTLNPWVRDKYGDIVTDVSTTTVYLDSLYYSVTTLTTVGYGDRVPFTDAEKVMSILCELAGSVIFGIIAGSLSAIAMSETMARREIKARSAMLDEFMRTKNVPHSMRLDIGGQLANYFEKKSALDEAEIIGCLPPKHQRGLVMSIYKPYLRDCPLVQGLDDTIISRLCMAMRPYLALNGDTICTEGEVGEEMFLITRGAVKLESASHPSYATRVWEDGAFFGELPLLDCGATDEHNKPVLHIYTAKALIDSHCTYITRKELDAVDQKRPRLKITMTKFALQRAKRFGVDIEAILETKRNLLEKQAHEQVLYTVSQTSPKSDDPCHAVDSSNAGFSHILSCPVG